MIITFYVLASLMLLSAVCAVCRPLLSRRQPEASTSEQLTSLYQQKRAELALDQQLPGDKKVMDNFAQQSFMRQATQQELRSQRASIWLVVLLVLSFITAALVGYSHWGAFSDWQHYLQQKDTHINVKQELKAMGGVSGLTASLQAKLNADPKHPHGWFLLGKMYMSEGKFDQAVQALTRSNSLKPKQPEVMTTLAEAIFADNHQRLTKSAKQLLTQSLQIAPNNIEAINLLAINAYVTHHYQTAIRYWEQMIPYFDPQSDDAKQLFSMIHQAQQKLH